MVLLPTARDVMLRRGKEKNVHFKIVFPYFQLCGFFLINEQNYHIPSKCYRKKLLLKHIICLQ